MAIRVKYLRGSISAGATWTKVDEVTVPSTETWRLREIRILGSADGVFIRLYRQTELLVDTIVDVSNAYKLPIPLDEEVRGGEVISLEANNPTSSAVTVVVEIIYEMAR